MLKKILFFTLLLFNVLAAPAQSFIPTDGVLYVKKGGDGNLDGSSWEHAAANLADVLKWVYEHRANWTEVNPIKVYVAKGTYLPKYSPEDGENHGTDQGRDNCFYLGANTHLYGGFDPDNNITNLSHTRISGPGGSILSGDLNNNDQISGEQATLTITNNEENTHHVLMITGPVGGGVTASNTLVDNFTITGGHANGTTGPLVVNTQNFYRDSGAGITVDYFLALTLTNLIVTGNAATGSGGGIHCSNLWNDEATPTLFTQLTISHNTAGSGGGMFNLNASPRLTQSTISSNKARLDGGGVRNFWSSAIDYSVYTNASFYDVTITGNHSDRDGGGMANNLMSVTLENVTISQNTAKGHGGGMYNFDRSSPRLTNVQVTDNAAGVEENRVESGLGNGGGRRHI